MNRLEQLLADYGILLPGRDDAIETAIAGGIIFLSLAAGVLAGRSLGPRLAAFWKTHVAHHGEGVWARMGAIVRHGTAALLLALALAAWPWVPLAAFALGLTLGCAVGFLAHQLLRGLGIPRWMAWVVALVLFVAILSHAVGGLAPITAALERVGFAVGRRRFSLLSLVTIVVVVTGLFAAVRLANRVIGHAIGRAKGLDATQKLLGQKLASIAIVVVAFFLGLDLLDIDLTAFALFSGGLGLAVGFGLQKTVGNLIAGIILLLDRSVKPGDVIVVGETFGSVEKIGVRAVSVVTRDGKEHLIPNENLMTERVENWSFTDRNVRVRIPVGVGYDSDLKLAQELMLQAARESPRVLDTPRPNVWLTDYGNDAVEHEILAWISDPESGVGNVRSDVLNRLWHLFKAHGITIPFAQRDLYLRGVSPDAAAALGVSFRQQSVAD